MSIPIDKISTSELAEQIKRNQEEKEKYEQERKKYEVKSKEIDDMNRKLQMEIYKRQRDFKNVEDYWKYENIQEYMEKRETDIDVEEKQKREEEMKKMIDEMDNKEKISYLDEIERRKKDEEKEMIKMKEKVITCEKDKKQSETKLKLVQEECEIMRRRFEEEMLIYMNQMNLIDQINETKNIIKKSLDCQMKEGQSSGQREKQIPSNNIYDIMKYIGTVKEIQKLKMINKRFGRVIAMNTRNFSKLNDKREFIRELLMYENVKEINCDNYFLEKYHEEKEAPAIREILEKAEIVNLKLTMPMDPDLVQDKLPKAKLRSISFSTQFYVRMMFVNNPDVREITMIIEKDEEPFQTNFRSALEEIKHLEKLTKIIIEGDLSMIIERLEGIKFKSNCELVIRAFNATEVNLFNLKNIQHEKILVSIQDEIINPTVFPFITRNKLIDGKQLSIVTCPRGIIKIGINNKEVFDKVISPLLPNNIVICPGLNINQMIEYKQNMVSFQWDCLEKISFQQIGFHLTLPTFSNWLNSLWFNECTLPETMILPSTLTDLIINRCDGVKELKINNKLRHLTLKNANYIENITYETVDMNIPSLIHLDVQNCQSLGSILLPYSVHIFSSQSCKKFKIKNAHKFRFFDPMMWPVLIQLGEITQTEN